MNTALWMFDTGGRERAMPTGDCQPNQAEKRRMRDCADAVRFQMCAVTRFRIGA